MRVFVPLQLHAQTPHAAIFGQPVELRTHVRHQKIRITDDRLRKSGLVGGLLHVSDFVLETILGPIRLHVDRFDDVAAGDVGREIRRIG